MTLITKKESTNCGVDDGKIRCWWVGKNKPHYVAYHDNDWGMPEHDDQRLFEMLILEGAQAGLSWETILKKRQGYRDAFHNFDPPRVAVMTDEDLAGCLKDSGIVRNRLKIWAARRNARIFIDIQKAFGSFDSYLWRFVDGEAKQNSWLKPEDVPPSTSESEVLSKDLRRRGMTFVGPTIIYAMMQSCGLVNDHLIDCWCYEKCQRAAGA